MFHVEQRDQWKEVLVEGASALRLQLKAHHLHAFTIYLEQLRKWNRKFNLTAIRDEKEVVIKHFLDSLACSKALDQTKEFPLLDIGSGAGFPGLPLKILHPRIHLTLIDPSQKKTAFLHHIIGLLDIQQATVLSERIQDIDRMPDYHRKFSYIVTRALNVTQLFPSIRLLLAEGGRLILCRTKPLENLDVHCGLSITKEILYELPYRSGRRVLTVLQPSPL